MKTEGAKSDINQTIRIIYLVGKLSLDILQYNPWKFGASVSLCATPLNKSYTPGAFGTG
jgi:hypothetical protein